MRKRIVALLAVGAAAVTIASSFVQANGDFTTADGRPYLNVYLFRYDWQNGQAVSIEEYANPVTFCRTVGHPTCS